MIIYNITVNIDNDVKQQWLDWMKQHHIPQVMNTGCFVEHKICKVLVDEEQGTTYSVQYTCNTMDDYEAYKNLHAPRLRKDVTDKFANKLVAFSTLLEIL
jgi:hypothetical protein